MGSPLNRKFLANTGFQRLKPGRLYRITTEGTGPINNDTFLSAEYVDHRSVQKEQDLR